MKIAFAYDSAYPWFNGGIERRRLIIAEEFLKRGHELHFFTMYREGMPSNDFIHGGIHYHCVASAVPASRMYINGKRNAWWAMKYGFMLFFAMLPYRFDFVDSDSFPFFHVFGIWAYCRIRHSRFIMTWHEVWTKQYWKEYTKSSVQGSIGYWIEKLAARTTDRFIANSDSTMEGLVREFGADRKNIKVVRAGVSSDEVRKHRSARKLRRRFLIIGRLIPEKRVDVAIRAMRNVNAELLVAGSGPERAALERMAKREGVSGKVIFRESLSRKELMRQMESATALIITSAREGLSMVAAEAICSGTPVMITEKTMLPPEVRRMCTMVKENTLGKALSDSAGNAQKLRHAASRHTPAAIRMFSASGAVQAYLSLLRGT